ncbi:MAG: anaerobic sulfatase maturase [Myxococcales bacterium]|jgi:uncharacterized protein
MSKAVPAAFHVMAKATGARCNLACDYCFFLKKERLYPGSTFRMSDEVMQSYVRQVIEAHRAPEVTIAWQGGEPTLMGIDFFRRAVAEARRWLPPGRRLLNTLQTNGVLIDEQWCDFLRENRFLVGLSLDGPRALHDAHRHDKAGHSVFNKVVRAARLMQRHGVDFNVLCTVNAANSRRPLEVYRFFRDELGARYLQLIPIVERENDSGHQEGSRVTSRTVAPDQYGRFLIDIFDEWIRRDVGEMFVQIFDGVLVSWLRGVSSLCIFRPTCGEGVALEHNGDLYSCDHFVEPDHLLGNILETPLAQLVGGEKQRRFGETKSNLPQKCRSCRFLFACHGECPKNRIATAPDGEPGLNWLCSGLEAFFAHTERPMRLMAELLRRGGSAPQVMELLRRDTHPRTAHVGERVGPNQPCPCGSGAKFKRCHGRPVS